MCCKAAGYLSRNDFLILLILATTNGQHSENAVHLLHFLYRSFNPNNAMLLYKDRRKTKMKIFYVMQPLHNQ